MASWRDIVQEAPASFRGVSFIVDRARLTTGRAIVKHEYPFREGDPYVEDLGSASRVYPVEGFVVGDGYLDAKEALLKALESGGPGTLIHPYYGTKTVAVGEVSVDETHTEGGCARFSITFHATLATPAQPTVGVSGSASILKSAGGALISATSLYNTVNGVISPVVNGVSGALRSVSNAINALQATVALVPQAVAQLRAQVTDIISSAEGLAQSPGDLVTAITGAFDSLQTAVSGSNVGNPLSVFLGLYGFDPGPRPVGTTPDVITAQANFDSTQLLIQRVAVVEAAITIAGMTFASFDEAIAARQSITALIDDLNDRASDDTYPDFAQLAADLVKGIPGDGNDLPHLLAFTPQTTIPSLVLAHNLYPPGTIKPFATLEDAELDISARNHVNHPGFILGGGTLEILSGE